MDRAKDGVSGREVSAADGLYAVEGVDPPDELDVTRAPRGIGSYGLHVFGDGELRGFVVPGQRQSDDARGYLHIVDCCQGLLARAQLIEEPFERQQAAVVGNLQ